MSKSDNQARAFSDAMRQMRRHDPDTQEQGFFALQANAAEHLPDLVREFWLEKDHGLRCWLLELIGDARSPAAYEFLAEQLRGDDELLRLTAIDGLAAMDTKDARRLLWEAKSWDVGDPAETASFHLQVEAALSRLRAGRVGPD